MMLAPPTVDDSAHRVRGELEAMAWGPGASGNGQTDVGKIGNLCTLLDGLLMPRFGGAFL
jgi:hypothetical protein